MEKLRAELNKEQQHLLDELRQQMAATHKAEIEQAQLQSQVKERNTVITVVVTWLLQREGSLIFVRTMCALLCSAAIEELGVFSW